MNNAPNANLIEYPFVFTFKNHSYVFNKDMIIDIIHHQNELVNQKIYQDMIILISFLIVSEVDAGIEILSCLNEHTQQEVFKTIRTHKMEKEYLDDPNLEYGVIAPKIIKQDLFNTFLQFGRLEPLRYIHAINKDFDIHQDNDHAFKVACENGFLGIAQWLFSLGNINLHDENEYVFKWACKMGHLEMAKWLYQISINTQSPINIHADNEYAFRWSCKLGLINIPKWLLSLDKIDIHAEDEYSFKWSCWLGNIEVAKWLYEYSLSIQSPIRVHTSNDFAFRWAARNGHLEVLKWLYSLGDTAIHAENHYAFRWLCRNGYLKTAQWLYALGNTDIHAENEYALRFSCENGHFDVVKWLYQVSITDKSPLNFHAEDDYSVRSACANGHKDIVAFLCQKAKVNFQAENNEGFRLACENGHLEFVKWLYDFGAKIGLPMTNRIYAYDDYAFRKACQNYHRDVLQWLYSKAKSGIRENYLYAAKVLYGVNLYEEKGDIIMNERNKVFFHLYETVFILLKEEFGEEKALEMMSKLFRENLTTSYGHDFKKGVAAEFARIAKGHDNNVGLHVEFPEVEEDRLVYHFIDDPFPGLRGLVDPYKLDASYLKFKIEYILGPEWKYKTTKHLWNGDEYTEHVIYK